MLYSTTELEKDIVSLESGLAFIQREVEWHKNKATTSTADRFARAMQEFLAVAVDTMADVRAQYDQMTKLVSCPPQGYTYYYYSCSRF